MPAVAYIYELYATLDRLHAKTKKLKWTSPQFDQKLFWDNALLW